MTSGNDYYRRRPNAGTALLGFGASLGMGLQREWSRASKEDKAGGFMNWMMGKKAEAKKAEAEAKAPAADPAQAVAANGAAAPQPAAADTAAPPLIPPADVEVKAVDPMEIVKEKPLDDSPTSPLSDQQQYASAAQEYWNTPDEPQPSVSGGAFGGSGD